VIAGLRAESAADQRLLDTVRPDDWENPAPGDRYDLLVVGAGTGGLVSAAIGAALGARVALVERSLMGGDCLNHGCVPSKAVLRAARSWAAARASTPRFDGPAVSGPGDFARVMERMRTLRADIASVDGAERFRDLGVDVYLGEGRFVARDALEVDGRRLEFRRAVLATGARAAMPDIPGLADAPAYTNETIFGLAELPNRLVAIGAGPIGVELSQAFARFGAEVTLVDRADRPAPREEPEASALLLDALEGDGVAFVGGATVRRVEPEGSGGHRVVWERGGAEHSVTADAILLAVGRTPNLDLDLEAAGIRRNDRGVDVDRRLRTSNRRVYAVGDVIGGLQFTHLADAHARMAVRNALFFGRGRADGLVVPMTTYTSPEIARVGPTAAELEASGERVDTIRVELADVDRARLDGEEEGFLAVHLRRGSDTILGATMVWAHAGEVIPQLTRAIRDGTGLQELGETIYAYPTTSEAVRKAADAYRRRSLTSRTEWLFEQFFKVTRLLP